MKKSELRQIIKEEISKILGEDELKIGELYDVYFKRKPSHKWFRGLKLKSIGRDILVFDSQIDNGWDIDVNKKEFLDNGWIKPSTPE
jgi:hypothetical protein